MHLKNQLFLQLSPFAMMWMALFGWITCSSLAYIYGCDESSQEDFLEVNGREYPYKIVLRDGLSAEIRRTIDGCVCRALPALVRELGIRIPVSTLEKTLVWSMTVGFLFSNFFFHFEILFNLVILTICS